MRGYQQCRICGWDYYVEQPDQDICILCSNSAGFLAREFNQEASARWKRRASPTFEPRPCEKCQTMFTPNTGKTKLCQDCRDYQTLVRKRENYRDWAERQKAAGKPRHGRKSA